MKHILSLVFLQAMFLRKYAKILRTEFWMPLHRWSKPVLDSANTQVPPNSRRGNSYSPASRAKLFLPAARSILYGGTKEWLARIPPPKIYFPLAPYNQI